MKLKLPLLVLMILSSLSALSQSYQFECQLTKYKDGAQNHWMCSITEQIKGPKLYLKARPNSTITFFIPLFNLHDDCRKLYQNDKEYSGKLFLSNGEIFSFTGECYFWQICFGSQDLKSNRKSVNDYGGYAMSQLRKFNITKIKYGDYTFNIPNYRSAATIDAMCKEFLKHIEDVGQFGSAQNKSSKSTINNNKKAVTRISADVENVSISHKQLVDGEECMVIKSKMTVSGMKGKQIKLVGFFMDKDGNDIPCNRSGYKTSSNTLCAKKHSEVTYDNSVWNELKLSIPYSLMNLQKNSNNTIKFILAVRDWDNDNTIFKTETYTTTFYYEGNATDDCGKWPSMTSNTNFEYNPKRVKLYIERPLGIISITSYTQSLGNLSNFTPYVNRNKQIQLSKDCRYGIWFYGICPTANVFFTNGGNSVSYYNYLFPFPKSEYSSNEVIEFCRYMKYCAGLYGYSLTESYSGTYKASGYGNGKSVSIEMGTLGNDYGVELKIIP